MNEHNQISLSQRLKRLGWIEKDGMLCMPVPDLPTSQDDSKNLIMALEYIATHDYRGSGYSMTKVVSDMREVARKALESYRLAALHSDVKGKTDENY